MVHLCPHLRSTVSAWPSSGPQSRAGTLGASRAEIDKRCIAAMKAEGVFPDRVPEPASDCPGQGQPPELTCPGCCFRPDMSSWGSGVVKSVATIFASSN